MSLEAGLLLQAKEHHRAGRLPQAEAIYRQILLKEPSHHEVLCLLGMLTQQTGRIELAVDLLSRAVGYSPKYPDAHYNLGNAFSKLGKLEEAAASYRRALELRPNWAEVYNNLGNTLKALGRLDEAAACFRQAIFLKPNSAMLFYNLGNALKDQCKLEEAVVNYRQALALQPDYVYALNNLGTALNEQGKLDEALGIFRQVLALKPDFVDAHNNMGNAFMDQGKPEEAVACYRRALVLQPNFVDAYNNVGNALSAQGRQDEAVASFRQALSLKPDFEEALNNLGNALRAQGRLDEAAASIRQALSLKPDFEEALNNLGNVLKAQGQLEEAIDCYRRALALRPDDAEAHSNLLLCLNYLPALPVSTYQEEAQHFGRLATGRVGLPFSNWRCAAGPKSLRVGLVSGDLWNHPVGFFLENILASIDPGRIDLIAYPTHHQEDELTARIRPFFAAWKPLLGLGDEAAARLIHDDGVHILFDLSGHTSHNRLPVFAWKPAPVQVSWLGYSASTGLAEMDYLLADPYVVPMGEETHFIETIWRLPESFLCFSPPRVTLEVAPLPALKEGRLTFGCFNNPTKMNDSVVALWARVLHAIPDSRLLLRARRFLDQAFCEATRQRFAGFGITGGRLLLEGQVLSREEHLAVFNRVDIALDPFPYNGTTTTVEGLWMGVPFLTRRGDRFVSHVGESIAHNISLADWIAIDDEDYVAKATAQAANLEKLAQLRVGLRQQVLASPLFDAPCFARSLEAAMFEMWQRFRAERRVEP